MANKRDYYEVLGVDKNADAGTIKKAYNSNNNVISKKDLPERRMPVTILTIPLPFATTNCRRYLSRDIIIIRVFFMWLTTYFILQI